MIKRLIFILLFSVCVFGQNTVCFEIELNPNPQIESLSFFEKYVNVLDCIHIYAEGSISDVKVLHAASIAAELLDNNEDGIIDDINVKNELMNLYTIMPLFAYEGSPAEDLLFDNFDNLMSNNNFCAGAVLYNNEISPLLPGFWGDDATVEEVLHTINACSQIEIYSDIFGLEPNSSQMSNAMDIARGGQFLSIPNEYPEESWYHYDDWTCDYECMGMEYLYWCIVTNMGLLDNNGICSGISNEWELCTAQEFENIDVLMYDIITNPNYHIPQLPPDGNYCPTGNTIIQESKFNRKLIKKIDLLGQEIDYTSLSFEIYNDGTIHKLFHFKQ